MALVDQLSDTVEAQTPLTASRMERQIRDYSACITGLIWQRQAIFLAAAVLTMFYFDPAKSLACYTALLFNELSDLYLSRRLEREPVLSQRKARRYLRWILANTVISALGVCLFAMVVAMQQGAGGHFTPLFFLFAAALFAAMNNHQIFVVLAVRLAIYGVTFMAIVLMDILRYNPPLDSELWLHFFTVIFVMYFIIDCSFVFMSFYRKNVRQLEELRQEHERTKIAYRAKSQFVATVSHELRTPLTSIKGSLDLINTGVLGPIPEEMAPIMSIAGKNSTRLADLINDILDLQKIEAGEVAYQFAPVDVRDLILDAVDANAGYATTLDIALQADLVDGETVFTNGDEKRLMQVMSNMISNALKFSREGGMVTVGYSVEGRKVRIWVKDQGIGIPENARAKVFGKFTQVDNTDQREKGGTGLGMNISQQIIEHHNGTIDYVSVLGKGTTFFIELDVSVPETIA